MRSFKDRGTEPLFVEQEEKGISLLDLLIVLSRHRRRILLWTVGGAILGLVAALLLPNKYTANTAILPPQQSSTSSGAAIMAQLGSLSSMAGAGGAGSLGLKNPNDLQVAMLKSRTVEDAVIARFQLMQLYKAKRLSDARKKLEKTCSIESNLKDGLIRISFTDTDPNRAAEIANGYVDEFKKFSATLAVTEASQRRLFFEQQLSQAKDSLADAEEDLKKTEQETGLIQLDGQARAAIESAAQLRAQISAKEVQIRAMRSFATSENPKLEMAQQELEGLQAEQAKLGSSADNGLLMPKGVMQEAGLKYVRKLRNVKYYQTIFDLLARQYEAAKVDEARQGSVVQVVDRAIVPDRPSSPKMVLMTLGVAILGMIACIGWVFFLEGIARLSKNPEERTRLETLRGLFGSRKEEAKASSIAL